MANHAPRRRVLPHAAQAWAHEPTTPGSPTPNHSTLHAPRCHSVPGTLHSQWSFCLSHGVRRMLFHAALERSLHLHNTITKMFLNTRASVHGQQEQQVVVGKDSPQGACDPSRDVQHYHIIPTRIVETCGVLSCLLETSGCAVLPFAAPQAMLWLSVRQHGLSGSPQHHLTPHELLDVCEVRSLSEYLTAGCSSRVRRCSSAPCRLWAPTSHPVAAVPCKPAAKQKDRNCFESISCFLFLASASIPRFPARSRAM